MNRSTLGSTIRALRIANGMTQAGLAELLHVTDKAVSKWERDLSTPDIHLIPALADILGATVSDLLRECAGEAPTSRLLQIFAMSQDIRTPIHIILGCADLAEMYWDDPAKRKRYLESIRVSGQYLLEKFEIIRKATPGSRQDGSLKPEDIGEYFRHHPESSASAPCDLSGRRILVTDDIELNREIAGEILKQAGAEVEYAGDGAECLELVERAPAGYYDLILMDLSMPNLDGIEAARRIRHLPDAGKAAVPIAAMTANVYEEDRRQAYEAGMNAFIEKPVSIDRLYATLQELLPWQKNM